MADRDSRRSVPIRQPRLREGRASVAEEHDLRECQRVGMGDRHQRSTHQHVVGSPGSATVELQARRSATSDHLDVFPEHAPRVTRAERFHRRFLCGKAAGEMWGRVSPLGTIGNLAGGEDASQEAFAVSFEHCCDARDVGCVKTNTENIHARATA